MNWIKEHKIVSIIVLVALVLCVLLVGSFIKGGTVSFIGRGIENVVAKVSGPVAASKNGMQSMTKGIFKYSAVVRENEELKEQIGELESEIINLTLSNEELKSLKELSNVLNYTGIEGKSGIVTADVIGMDGANWFNIFTINAGTEKGIYKDAVVVNGVGLVGKVIETGNGWSKVMSVVDESNKISFEVFRDIQMMGVVQGNGKGMLLGFMFDGDAGIIEGDRLLTSGIGIFPEGIEIGKVTSVLYNKDTQLKTIEIEPKVSFQSIKRVTVMI